ncbi:MAG TPA: hypothetical protein VNR36_12415 [Pseudolysinimonas sp.]|nr:hypothetical protein [Pseudolysinimonas sp.]
MEWVVLGAVVIGLGVLGVVAQHKGWIDMTGAHARGRGGGVAGLVGGLDEVFAPTRFEASKERERQVELPAPAPAPGDPGRDPYSGSMTIDLSATSDPDTRRE